MQLNGIHHITAITGDAPGNVDFYVRVLGLRLVKKSVNQDDPTVYHLFYGDEQARPGADLTFFEYPGARPGRSGSGMVHRIIWRVRDGAALDFWERRLRAEGVSSQRAPGTLRFADPEGLQHELNTRDNANEPLVAESPEVPAEHALLGFAGARAYAATPMESERFAVDTLGFETSADGELTARGSRRSSTFAFDKAEHRGTMGAGAVHHIAWWSEDDEHAAWGERLRGGGADPTPVINRYYFRSIYFFEPSRVLFELATESPGFAVDEPAEHLGERLSLPPRFEPMRDEIEHAVAPLPNPRIDTTG